MPDAVNPDPALAAKSVRERLDADRRELLDLSLRNPLLNYRPRARGLEIVGESSVEVFRSLVLENKRMSFVPVAETTEPAGAAANEGTSGAVASAETASETPGADSACAAPVDSVKPTDPRDGIAPADANRFDSKLQTTLAADALPKRLLSIYHIARTALEEQGVSTLFMALGMLRWFEADDAKRALLAPLVLVPVELERSGARELFRMRYTEGDLETNLSLSEKLRAEFALELPAVEKEDDEFEPGAYYDEVARRIEGRVGWEVLRDRIALGFFAFGKFLMYRDLDDENWPEGAKPSDHPLLRALVRDGFHEPPARIGAEENLDDCLKPGDLNLVLDADSSQTLAIVDAADGRSLVIQGPPGTGKSQTITNLIAEALGRGKTVLFVAEKLAALEVVKRRLDAVGLGNACLELHSHKIQKKAVLAELKRTLDARSPKRIGATEDLERLREDRDRLNDFANRNNAPIGRSSVTPYEASGGLLSLRNGERAASVEIPSIAEWTEDEARRRIALTTRFRERLRDISDPRAHPFWGCRRTLLTLLDERQFARLLSAAKQAVERRATCSAELCRALAVPEPRDAALLATLLGATRRIAAMPALAGVDVKSLKWDHDAPEIRDAINAGRRVEELRAQYDAILLPDAWDRDVLETRSVLNTTGRRWWRWFSGRFRFARRDAATWFRNRPPRKTDELVSVADAIRAAQLQSAALELHDALMTSLFAARWRDETTDWAVLEQLTSLILELRQSVKEGRLDPALLDFAARGAGSSSNDSLIAAVEQAQADATRAIGELARFVEFTATDRAGAAGELETWPFGEQRSLVDSWFERPEQLRSMVELRQVIDDCDRDGLGSLIEAATNGVVPANEVVDATWRARFEALLDVACREHREMARFVGADHAEVIERFSECDRAMLVDARCKLAHEHWSRLPRHDGGGQLAVLRREFEKKARHLAVRRLLQKAGRAVQAIKPVFMMSPLSVAAYLPADSVDFDIVVFDEASQVRPVDGFGALLRGRSAVVVGDDKQLPPTSFFDRLTGGDEDSIDDDEDSSPSGAVGSILGLFRAQNAPQRMLRWHYRSRHESLIAVSNHEFYDQQLVIFPSPNQNRSNLGLVYHHLAHTIYDRGNSRTNRGEVDEIANRVVQFAREQLGKPNEQRQTLGVAAFSISQADAIRDRVEELRRRAEHGEVEEFFATGGPEPFFVKNLENVQGDERDVIYISVGYGRGADGRVSMNFGPLNGDGGERRLNVLITRARCRCEVFTNLAAEDLDLNRTSARGVRAFKTFLAFARDGRLQASDEAGAGARPRFEEVVRNELQLAGWEVRSRVGVGGYCVDLAVVDPDCADRFLAGIECDGPKYASARSARDRDRLREQVLENLGWRICRVWSQDWIRDRKSALARLLEALAAARARDGKAAVGDGDAIPATTTTESASDVSEPAADRLADAGDALAYCVAEPAIELDGLELSEASPGRVAAWVAEVVSVEGPVHADEVARRIVDAAGVKRIGNRIRDAIDKGIAQAERKGSIVSRGDFLWPPEMKDPPLRDRGGLQSAQRKLELVSPEELAVAIEKVVAESFGIEQVAIPALACKLLGFARVNDEAKQRVDDLVRELVARGRLVNKGEHVVLATT